MTATDTLYRVLCDWQYREFGFEESDTSWSVRDIFNIFATLEKNVFGYTKYKIKDGRVFGYSQETQLIVTETPTEGRAQFATEGYSLECKTRTVCITAGPSTNSAGMITETVCKNYTTCTLVWIGGGPGPIPDPGGGGGPTGPGGPGNGNPTVPENPCPALPRGSFSTEVANLNPCDSTLWEPTILGNPCDGVDSLAANENFRNALTNLNNYTTDTVESGIVFNQDGMGNFTGISQKRGADSQNPYLDLSVTTLIDGFLHCHLANNLSVFSPEDIRAIARLYSAGNIANTSLFAAGVITIQGTQYILKIENEAKFAILAAKIIQDDEFYNYEAEFTYRYQIKPGDSNQNTFNELNFLNFLQNSLGIDSGLKLFRGNSDFGIWQPIKSDINNNVVLSPCN